MLGGPAAHAGGPSSPVALFPTGDPWTATQIATRLDAVGTAGAAFLRRLSGDVFFAAQGDRWSPAEHVRHLVKSGLPLLPALRLPRIALRVLFGTGRRPSRSFDALRDKYLDALAAGGEAGRFAPAKRAPPANLERGRERIVARWRDVAGRLRKRVLRRDEVSLDRCLLPHPLLGKLTLREMLFFTLYHEAHHLRLVASRLPEDTRAAALATGPET